MFIVLTALWLGILTSISPCPLASNIAAITFLSKKINHPMSVLFAGLAYIVGRMITYAILGVLIVLSLVNIPVVAYFLQNYMNRALGPILILVGFVVLRIIRLRIPRLSISDNRKSSLRESGIIGAGVLGVLFALSFCPISAALFFGSLIPLALNNRYGVILPLFYGIGTGLPVMLFAVGIALGVTSLSKWFDQVKKLESYTRIVTGILFIVVGGYYIWKYWILYLLQN